jgi:HSP20 family protein
MLSTYFRPMALRGPGLLREPGVFQGFDRLTREMSQLLAQPAAGAHSAAPAMNVWREGDVFVAEAEIPGFSMEDVEILATEDTLTIRGRRENTQPQAATPLHVERALTSFERTLRLGVEIDVESTKASLQNGVLRVTMPIAEQALPRRIEVVTIGSESPKALTQGEQSTAKAESTGSGGRA